MPICCRPLQVEDVGEVIELLLLGLPGRTRDFWWRGFQRLGALPAVEGTPRYGYVLAYEDHIVGVIITIHSRVDGVVRCNLSSWYVAPGYRHLASLMVRTATKREDVTYINISPNPRTWAIIESQRFRRYVSGEFISPLFLSRSDACLVRDLEASDTFPLASDHERFGCFVVVVEADDTAYPFVFLRETLPLRRLPMPAAHLLYSQSLDLYVRFAGAIGRHLLRRGVLVALHDANGPEPRLPGMFSSAGGPRYFRGPAPPRLGDLAYTEWALFGAGLRGAGHGSNRKHLQRLMGMMKRGRSPAAPPISESDPVVRSS